MNTTYRFDNLTLITGGDPTLDIDLLESFLVTSRDYIAALQTAHAANNAEAWLRETHSMKGGCFNLGADVLGNLCQSAETQARDLKARARILQQIISEFAAMEPIIQTMIAERRLKIVEQSAGRPKGA